MNKKMLMLSTFLSSSLLVTNFLQVVSCKKKGQKVSNGSDDEKTAQQVELEIVTKLKTEIRNTIDEIITNPIVNGWIIDLIVDFSENFSAIISSFNLAIETAKNNGKNRIELNQVSNLDEILIETVKLKFNDLSEKINERIDKKASELGVFDFTFEFDIQKVFYQR